MLKGIAIDFPDGHTGRFASGNRVQSSTWSWWLMVTSKGNVRSSQAPGHEVIRVRVIVEGVYP